MIGTQKLKVDVLLAQDESTFDKIKTDYENGDYVLAYEDFNKIDKDKTTIYNGNYTYLEKENENCRENERPSDDSWEGKYYIMMIF